MTPAKFVFAVCQIGFEAALKHEVGRKHPDLRFAFSRPGFVTFRMPDELAVETGASSPLDFRAAFARTWGFSTGKVAGTDADQTARAFWKTVLEAYGADPLAQFRHLHVWPRDRELPGDTGFEAARATEARDAGHVIMRHRGVGVPSINLHAEPGDLVLDCVLVEPNEWWLGWHRARAPETCWPGGVPGLQPPTGMISRAYLKLLEALLWAELPVRAGDQCVEIGSAPGGSCKALLERGCVVVGIDPAEMDPAVLAHQRFTHVRSRVKDVDRSVFRGCRWLTSDINLPPNYTLDAVEAIVGAPQAAIEGLVLTLKLADPAAQSDELPLYNKRIRSWGYPRVRARQLAFNRQEVCVVATRS